MPRLFPVPGFMCTRTDYGKENHDNGDTICHACFDKIFPWTTQWDQYHKRINIHRQTIRPCGDLEYLIITDSDESSRIERCIVCDRIVIQASCIADTDDAEYCECPECDPATYELDREAVESGEYDRTREQNTRSYHKTAQERRLEQRAWSRRMRKIYQEIGTHLPECFKAKQRKVR